MPRGRAGGGDRGGASGLVRGGRQASGSQRESGCRRRHGKHGLGDHRLHGLHLGLGAGVLHTAHRLLEGVHHRRHGHHHRHLLCQPMEDVRYRLHRCRQLQGLPLHAGAGWSASLRAPIPIPAPRWLSWRARPLRTPPWDPREGGPAPLCPREGLRRPLSRGAPAEPGNPWWGSIGSIQVVEGGKAIPSSGTVGT